MAKSNRCICPHCGETINLNKVFKNNRKQSAEFLNADYKENQKIEKLLKEKNIEFGVVPNRNEVDNI